MNYEAERQANGGSYGWLMVGWSACVWDGGYRVEQGCSSGHFHATRRTDRTTTQGGGRFYRTRREALIEARHRLQELCANKLAVLDRELESP